MTLCHWAPLHPSEAAGGGGGSAPACAATRWPCLQAIPEQEGASRQRISDQAFYIHPWCDHTSFRGEASGMDLG